MDWIRRLALGLVLALGAALVAESAIAQDLCVTAARANLRAGPGREHRVNWTVYKHMPLVQVEKQGEWIRVKDVDGDLHWVFERLVTTQQKCVTVSATVANIRRGPGAKFRKWFAVKRYTSFLATGAKDNWVRIEYEGEVMWVFHTLIWPRPS